MYPKLPEALRAAEKLTLPPWGMLTGVRPDKPITRALMEGKPPEEAKRELKARYFVPEDRAALALETGAVGYQALKRLEKRDIDLYVGVRMMNGSDAILDQLYSYTPPMITLTSSAYGVPIRLVTR